MNINTQNNNIKNIDTIEIIVYNNIVRRRYLIIHTKTEEILIMKKTTTREQELYIKKVRTRRKMLLEKKARKELRADKLVRISIALMGAGILYLFFGIYGLGAIGLYTVVRYFTKEIEEGKYHK